MPIRLLNFRRHAGCSAAMVAMLCSVAGSSLAQTITLSSTTSELRPSEPPRSELVPSEPS